MTPIAKLNVLKWIVSCDILALVEDEITLFGNTVDDNNTKLKSRSED